MQTLFLPAIVAFLIFVVLTFVVVPVWQHYRNRYSHYLPIDTLSSQTVSLGHRMQAAVGRFFSRASPSPEWRPHAPANESSSGSNSGIAARLRAIFRRRRTQTAAGSEMLSDDEDDGSVFDVASHGPGGISLGEVGEELGTMRPGAQRLQGGAGYDTRRLSRE